MCLICGKRKNRSNTERIRYLNGSCPCQGVPAAGLEPARYRYQWILSPPRLPFRQAGIISYNADYSNTLSNILQAEFFVGFDCLPPAYNSSQTAYTVTIGGRQMRSIFKMPSDDLAGGACAACRYQTGGRQMRSIFRMPSDDLAGGACAACRYKTRRK